MNFYCPEHFDSIYMKGIRDSAYFKDEHTYLKVEVSKCQDSNRAKSNVKVDPNCKDEEGGDGEKCELEDA